MYIYSRSLKKDINYTTPVNTLLQNNKYAWDNVSFVTDEIRKLASRGCVRMVTEKPNVVNPLSVAYNNKIKPRLVLDCRHVNPHLFQFRFMYEDASVAVETFPEGSYLFSFNFKIRIPPYNDVSADATQNIFGVWLGGTVLHNVLPFGSTAGHSFTKVTKEVVKHWRSGGFSILMYLDDGIGRWMDSKLIWTAP